MLLMEVVYKAVHHKQLSSESDHPFECLQGNRYQDVFDTLIQHTDKKCYSQNYVQMTVNERWQSP